jgi:imidazoleglycerol-phosphate dehydratase
VQPDSSTRPLDNPPRVASIERETRETKVAVTLGLDGSGKATIATGLGFFDHMLELFAGHGLFDVRVEAGGDLHTGGHHTVEDIGICLGLALAKAVGDKKGINRYGSMLVPMDESLVLVALDLSGRPYFAYEGGPVGESIAGFNASLVAEFFRAVVNNAKMTLHVRVLAGGDAHHTIEAMFKAFGKALRQAVSPDPRVTGIPSTKGVL